MGTATNGQQLAPYVRTPDLDNEAYHREREHESSSTLKLARESPGRWKLFKQGEYQRLPKESQKLGTLNHIVLLERDRLAELVAVIPAEVLGKKNGEPSDEGTTNTNDFREWAAAPENAKRLQVKLAAYREAIDMADEILENPDARAVIERATTFEQNIFWFDGVDKLKCRLDLANEIDAELTDVKTCAGGTVAKFVRAIEDNDYLAQAALYCEGYFQCYGVRPTFRWLVIPTERPYSDCFVKRCPAAGLAWGGQKNRATLAEIRERIASGDWLKDECKGDTELELKPWMLAVEVGECEARDEY
jgi:exodeoxyribonuclease VIII